MENDTRHVMITSYSSQKRTGELNKEELHIQLPPKSTAVFLNGEFLFPVKSFHPGVFPVFFFFFQISQCFPQGRKQNSIIFQLVLSVTNVYFCKVLLDHQMKVTGEVENVIKKFTDLIFHRFRLHLPAKYYSSLSTVKSVTRFKMKLDCVF